MAGRAGTRRSLSSGARTTQSGPMGPGWDRDGTASVPFPVAPSLCFHTVFLAHGTDGTGMGQRPGPISGSAKPLFPYCFFGKMRPMGPGLPPDAACAPQYRAFFARVTMRQRHGMQPRSTISVLSQSQQFSKSGPNDCGKPQPSIAPTIARKPWARSHVLRRYQAHEPIRPERTSPAPTLLCPSRGEVLRQAST